MRSAVTDYERQRKVRWMREAEIKHARLAMMAAAGWPMAELLDGPLSKLFGLPYGLEATGGRAPGLFNGHMFDGANGAFILATMAFTAYLEVNTLDNVEGLTTTEYMAGDLKFDPANFSEKKEKEQLALAEIKHGRVAMLAVAGYAVQELLYGTPVVAQTPQFVSRQSLARIFRRKPDPGRARVLARFLSLPPSLSEHG